MTFSGGFVPTIVSSLVDTTVPALTGAITNPGSFAISPFLNSAVSNVGNTLLTGGRNYALSQISNVLPPSLQNGVVNQLVNTAINAGLDSVASTFVNAIPGLGSFIPNLGNITSLTGTTGPQGRQPGLAGLTDSLPPADYGGLAYTLKEVVFTITPYQTGASTAVGPQTSPMMDLTQVFNSDVLPSFPGSAALKNAVNFDAQFSPISKQVFSTDFTKTITGAPANAISFDTSKLQRNLGTTDNPISPSW